MPVHCRGASPARPLLWGRLLAGLLTLASLTAAAESPVDIGWADLRPPAGVEDNPFATLSEAQKDALRDIVLAGMQQWRGGPAASAASERRAALTRQLAQEGLDADALLTRRESLMSERRGASEAGVAQLDGRMVALAGYALPLAPVDGQTAGVLLVPWVGACSHTPPPPANQIVRVRSSPAFVPSQWFERVTVRGRLQVRPEHSELFLVDGAVGVKSTYVIEDAVIETLPPEVRR